jgi:GNAT superfamily N-acetyltransferase
VGSDIKIIEVTDADSFALLPPCADPRFDHRSCDYWEDDIAGSKASRPGWWRDSPATPRPKPAPRSDNPFAPPPASTDDFNPFAPGAQRPADPFAGDDPFATPAVNPFAPTPAGPSSDVAPDAPRKLRLLDRGHGVFGSYAKVLLHRGEPAAFSQFGPLSAYPRAQQIRELYPALPRSPLPAVITCIATTVPVRGSGFGRALVEAVAVDLAGRGFAAIEAYPDLSLEPDASSAATPDFWRRCGFDLAAADERFPVMRRELD